MLHQLGRHSQHASLGSRQRDACARGLVQRHLHSVRSPASTHGGPGARLTACTAATKQDWDTSKFLQLLKDRQQGEPSAYGPSLLCASASP